MSKLELLLSYADTSHPVLDQGMNTDAALIGTEPQKQKTRSGFLWKDEVDANDLVEQQWAVIAPEGPEGDRLLALIAPLIRLRQTQQENEVAVYRVPPGLSAEAAVSWKKQVFDTSKKTKAELPRYQLILGDLHQVSLALQQVMCAMESFIGRLAFIDDQGYESYVQKVLRWEQQPSTDTQGRQAVFTVHDGSGATSLGYNTLVAPGLNLCQTYANKGKFPASEILECGDKLIPSPDEFLRLAAQPNPTMMFTLSHGLGTPRRGWSEAEQRLRQGAMSFGREGAISSADILQKPFLPGGIWFMLACYGAGTPDSSAYLHWLQALQKAGEIDDLPDVLASLPKPGARPFIAALPQAALRNPDGPLAFMGHIDLAWTYSFAELDTGQQVQKAGKFAELWRRVLLRDRVGVCFRELARYLSAVHEDLVIRYDNDARSQAKGQAAPPDPLRGHLWMLRQDLSGYVLLGDPAVQLPLRPTNSRPGPEPVNPPPPKSGTGPAAGPGTGPVAQPAPPLSPLPIPLDKLEEAIGHYLSGARAIKEIAMEYQIGRSELEKLGERYRQAGRCALGIKESP